VTYPRISPYALKFLKSSLVHRTFYGETKAGKGRWKGQGVKKQADGAGYLIRPECLNTVKHLLHPDHGNQARRPRGNILGRERGGKARDKGKDGGSELTHQVKSGVQILERNPLTIKEKMACRLLIRLPTQQESLRREKENRESTAIPTSLTQCAGRRRPKGNRRKMGKIDKPRALRGQKLSIQVPW